MGRPAAGSNGAFISALREMLGLLPLPGVPGAKPQRFALIGERSLSEASLQRFDSPDLDPERDDERPQWTEPRGGWMREQRRRGIGITKGKCKPRYAVR